MLIKFLTRSMQRGGGRLSQLIRYVNQGKLLLSENKDFILTNIIGETTTKGIAKHFQQNNKLIKKRNGKNIAAYHIVISWHPDERKYLDNETLMSFAKKFYELYEGDKAYAFISVHKDTKNYHLHCAFSASERDSGKSRRISKAKLKELQIAMNTFQRNKYPKLSKSLLYLPDLNRNRKKIIGEIQLTLPEKLKHPDGSYRAKKRGDTSILESLRKRLYKLAKKYPNKIDFLAALDKQTDLKPYTYRDKPRGIMVDGKKYTYRRLAIGDLDKLPQFIRQYDLEQLRSSEPQLELFKNLQRS